jgi:REP element-mobilizing transposase RayT
MTPFGLPARPSFTMPRGPRLDEPGALHHVMGRGIARRDLFLDDEDRARFVAGVERVFGETRTACFAWALMPNHYHLLVETGPVPLKDAMQRVNLRYAQHFNRRHDCVGHVLQGPYKSLRVDAEPYLLTLLRYIHLNPCEGGLVAGLDALDVHPWTGHAALMGNAVHRFQDVDRVLSMFGGDPRAARAAVRRFLQERLDSGDVGPPLPLPGDGLDIRDQRDALAYGVIGLRTRSAELETAVREATERDAFRARLAREGWTFDRVVEHVCSRLGVDPRELRLGSRLKDVTRTRATVAYAASAWLGMSQCEIARRLGIGQPSVAKAIPRGRVLAASLGPPIPSIPFSPLPDASTLPRKE